MTVQWASGSAYENYVGRWSRVVAPRFLTDLAVPAGKSWLDVGSGTGAMCETILRLAAPASVRGIDLSAAFVAHAAEHVTDPRVAFAVASAESLPFEAASFDAIVSALVLNFVPDPARAVAEMARVARPGATVGCYVWDYAGKMQFMRHFWNAATALDAAVAGLDEGRKSTLCAPAPLRGLFTGAGLANVEAWPIDIDTHFGDFDDFWNPFLGGQGPAPSYLKAQSDDRREAIRERLRAALPTAIDGSIPLVARVWAVRGRRS